MMSALETNFGQTPSQTVGPYFAYGLTGAQYRYDFDQPFDDVVAYPQAAGEHILLEGRVFDGDGKLSRPTRMIEISQADAEGKYAERFDKPAAEGRRKGFRGFGRMGTGTDPEHRFWFRHRQARRSGRRRSAAHQRDRADARHAAARLHPHLLQRRGRGQRQGPGAATRCRPSAATR